jgi:hypothetical protein
MIGSFHTGKDRSELYLKGLGKYQHTLRAPFTCTSFFGAELQAELHSLIQIASDPWIMKICV